MCFVLQLTQLVKIRMLSHHNLNEYYNTGVVVVDRGVEKNRIFYL